VYTGSIIIFPFFGTQLRVAIHQRNTGMGVAYVHIDNDVHNTKRLSGFGFTRIGFGRQHIFDLFDGLSHTSHNVTFTISNESDVRLGKRKGYNFQIIALLYSIGKNKNTLLNNI
jgi:hypothetical protein